MLALSKFNPATSMALGNFRRRSRVFSLHPTVLNLMTTIPDRHPVRRYVGRLRHFSRKMIQHYQENSDQRRLCVWISKFPDWQRSLDTTPVQSRRPWLTSAAIDFLNTFL